MELRMAKSLIELCIQVMSSLMHRTPSADQMLVSDALHKMQQVQISLESLRDERG